MWAYRGTGDKVVRKRLANVAARAGLRGTKKGKRFDVPVIREFRRCFSKTRKDVLADDSRISSMIEYMMGHQGLVKLDQNYKTDVLELARAYVEIVPDLTIYDAERLRRSNRMMAASIRQLGNEKGHTIARLEAEVAHMKGEMVARMQKEMSYMKQQQGQSASDVLSALRESPETDGIPGKFIESLTGMVREMVTAQKSAIQDIRAEYDAKIDKLLRAMDKMARGEV